MRRYGYVRLSRRTSDPSDRRNRRMRAPSAHQSQRPPVPPLVHDPAEPCVAETVASRNTGRAEAHRPSDPAPVAARSDRPESRVFQPTSQPALSPDPDGQPIPRAEPQASPTLGRDAGAPLLPVRRRGRKPRPSQTVARVADRRYDHLGLSDWSYEQPLVVVADPGEDEVDRLLAELFPRTNGGVQNHFYSDPNMPPVRQMPELHPEAEAVLDILDGADLPTRVASALQERRERREEEAQERARLEAEEALRTAKARMKVEAEEARKAAQTKRQQRADEAVRAAAEADRMRIAEEAKRARERRLADEAAKAGTSRAPMPADPRGRRKGRPRCVEVHSGVANVNATVEQVPPFKAWAPPVVVPAQAHPPEAPPLASDVAAVAAEPVSRPGDGGPRIRVDNVVQFPGPKRSNPSPSSMPPDIGAAQPKRRGRPPGSKNRVRTPPLQSGTVPPEVRPPTTPALRTTNAVSPALALRPLRRLSSSAYPLLTASFPLPSWRSINTLRDSWSRSLPYDTDVLEQARAALPSDCIRWRVRNGEVSFSEIVASVMTAGGQGARLLLFHDVHLGIAAIDVRCPRSQLVERWSKCIAAAKASLPAGCEMPPPEVLDQVERLRVDLKLSTLVECLWEIGLGVAVGSVEA